jgi:hypothetical protein
LGEVIAERREQALERMGVGDRQAERFTTDFGLRNGVA